MRFIKPVIKFIKTTETPGLRRQKWTEKWINGPALEWDQREKGLVERDWLVRWQIAEAKMDKPPRPDPIPDHKVVPIDPAPTKGVLRLHKELHKAESALLVQARTGRIGLARFLYSRKVPGIASAQCQCQAGEETPRHVALFCNRAANRRQQLMDPEGPRTNRFRN
jgi:hypothetical protein